MNKFTADVFKTMIRYGIENQRELCERLKLSLGKVNREIHTLWEIGLIDRRYSLTEKGREFLDGCRPENAVILAAGLGLRMIPLDRNLPKALLNVKGEVLIERLIRQLHEAGIEKITVVAGFMAEKFEYLIDRFGVKVVVNFEYLRKNNIVSLNCAREQLSNTYVVPSDLWFENNPFSEYEFYPWYMVTRSPSEYSIVTQKRDFSLKRSRPGETAIRMAGPCYLTSDVSRELKKALSEKVGDNRYFMDFWESVLFDLPGIKIYANLADEDSFREINTFEDFRDLESESAVFHSEVLKLVSEILHVRRSEIVRIETLKKGMTNRSFKFSCGGREYIMRIPGEGSQKLINRRHEFEVYQKLDGLDIADYVVYISPDQGYKLTEFWPDARVCDVNSEEDVALCMAALRRFHRCALQVGHTFDLFGEIQKYEDYLEGTPSVFEDYEETKRRVFSLKRYIDSVEKEFCLTHIDAVPDNFLFAEGGIKLIDWEYAGMQDPHVDIAMFAIYAMYDAPRIERLIDSYFTEGCDEPTRIKIWCYIAACGLLWSNWCEFKRKNGVEFDQYALQQYRYAKDYYRKVKERLGDFLE